MKIGPKDPFGGPQGPEESKPKTNQADFQGQLEGTETSGPVGESGDAGSTKSIFGKFQDTGELRGEFVHRALEDFQGSIAPGDLDRIGRLLQEHSSEDPVVQAKLDRILSLSK